MEGRLTPHLVDVVVSHHQDVILPCWGCQDLLPGQGRTEPGLPGARIGEQAGSQGMWLLWRQGHVAGLLCKQQYLGSAAMPELDYYISQIRDAN
jgi:hypothetical protein